MNRILPIYSNPYIRMYTHHGYLHAIASSSEKVLLDPKEPAAVIIVKDYDQLQWHCENKSLLCATGEKNRLEFFGNKWNLNMNMTFWRECKADDELCITVEKFIKTCPYANIHVFVTDSNSGQNVGVDYLHNFEFGIFAKDGVYFNSFSDKHTVLQSDYTFPGTLYLRRSSDSISICYTEGYNEPSECYTFPVESDKCKIIGFSIDLRCSSYYEWLFSNYINICVDLSNKMPIDYLCLVNKDYGFYTTNYFIDYVSMAETRNSYSLQYIKQLLNEKKYVEVMIDDMIHIGEPIGSFFHQDLIYGYDDEQECLHILYYDEGIMKQTQMSYTDYLSDKNMYYDPQLHIYSYCPGYEEYKMSMQRVLQIFKEYRASENISYYEHVESDKYTFGIDGIKAFLTEKGRKILVDDKRVTYFFYERSKCNRDRIEYMFCKGFLDEHEYVTLREKADTIMKHAERMKFTVMRNLRMKRKDDEHVFQQLKHYIDLECEFTDQVIHVLARHLLQIT